MGSYWSGFLRHSALKSEKSAFLWQIYQKTRVVFWKKVQLFVEDIPKVCLQLISQVLLACIFILWPTAVTFKKFFALFLILEHCFSLGYSCAKPKQPGIYHKVSKSSDWISYVTHYHLWD